MFAALWQRGGAAALALFGALAAAQAQSIFTVAGGGPIGDGGPATEALLREPWDTAVDAAGNLYISDTKNHRVRRVDAKTGIITTFAGGGTSGRGDGGPATEAEVNDPAGLAIDSEGNLYIGSGSISNTGSSPGDGVRRVSPDGIITSYARVDFVLGLAFDRDGNLHLASGCSVGKIDRRTGTFTTVAGMGTCGFSGDGGPATAAQVGGTPNDVAFDQAGNLYIADTFQNRVRRVDASSGIITTVAGNGLAGARFEPGRPATETAIGNVASIAFDADGNLFISGGIRVDARTGIAHYIGRVGQPGGPVIGARQGLTFDSAGNLFAIGFKGGLGGHVVERLAATSGAVSTIAGGRSIGDGAPATSSSLFLPYDVLALANGDLLFTDSGWGRIRKFEATSGRVTTVAGTDALTPFGPFNFDGVPALQATFPPPLGLARDSSGNLYFSTTSAVLMKIDAATGILTRFAGGFPAEPVSRDGLAVHPNGDVYIADSANHRIRKIDAQTSIITTFAGSGPAAPAEGSFAGDGGPATNARLKNPRDVAFDGAGNLYISDTRNGRIRKVDANGTITTIAGNPFSSLAEGPALQVRIDEVTGIHSDSPGNLWFTLGPGAVRHFDARTGRVSIIAGSGRFTYNGDGGPARAAGLNQTTGVAVDSRDTVFIADRSNNRIRAVFACVTLVPPLLSAPVDGATGIDTAPTLTWEKVDGAFRYDVFLATGDGPLVLVGSDVTATSLTLSNLEPGIRYSWRVVAKGDPFCTPQSSATSETRSFNTNPACSAPAAFALTAPADNASNVSGPLELTWSAAAGAGSYDVLLGTSNPPPVVASTPTNRYTASDLALGTTYYWSVIAHAACDAAKTRATDTRSFRTAGGCPTPGAFTQNVPRDSAIDVSTTATVEWSASANATGYDLYFGSTNPPAVYLPDLTTTTLTISSLTPATTYFWRVVAKAACDVSRTTSTPVTRFTVRSSCASPLPTSFRFTPPGSVAIGQTYVVAWHEASDLQAGGYYVVERASDASFSSIIDAQETTATSASFIASTIGTYYHRVTPVNPCSTGTGLAAQSTGLTVVSSPPNVVFTVQPEAILTTLGQNVEDKRGRFVIENIGAEAIPLIIGRQEIDSIPFFSIADPSGGDSTFITLEPRKPKEFEIRFSGPPNDKPASYQGVIFLAALGKGLANTPYAFVNLRVGGGEAATPQFRAGGTVTEYAFFPGFAGDDANRPPITVDIHNPGTTAMELGAEVGPEVWLIPESGWNSSAIEPGATRTVRLSTRRNRAPHGSALPRYTYFTVRTKAGLSARILVQDNDVEPTSAGRGSALDPSIRSYIVPEVMSADTRTFSTLRVSNFGSEAVQTDLFFTPSDADGFDPARVRRATIAIPPNDIVTLTDPLVQVWGLTRPAKGQIEVRTAPEKIGLLTVRSTVAQSSSGGGTFTYTVPSIGRGEGAQTGRPHEIVGISTTNDTRPVLTVAETSGADRAQIRVSLFDSDGNKKGERIVELPRYSMTEIDEITVTLGGGSVVTAARLELSVISGAGSAIGIVKLLDRSNGGGATLISRPVETGVGPSSIRALHSPSAAFATFILPTVFNGESFRTVVGLAALRDITNFTLTYAGSDGTKTATVSVPARRTIEYTNVLEQLLGIAPGATSEGTLTVEASAPADVYGRLRSGGSLAAVSQTLPVLRSDSEFIISNGSQLPLYIDGLDQSVDRSRGSRWMLILNELGGQGATLVARLYEAGNRGSPIAVKEFSLAGKQRMKLDNLFASMDLDNENRRKDRANILLSVAFKSGAGAAAALAMSIDNRTGDSKSYILTPAGGSALGVQKVTAVAPRPTGRRRAAGR